MERHIAGIHIEKNVAVLKILTLARIIHVKTGVSIAMQTIVRKAFLKTVICMMLILRFYVGKLQKMIKLQRGK